MTTATKRRPTTKRKPTRRPPRRTLTVTLGPTGSIRRTHHRRSLLWLVVKWASIWTARAAAWTGRTAVCRTAGHVTRARTAWREWDDLKAEHGRGPLVTDTFTGKTHKAHEVELDAPTGGDPAIRARQDEDARAVRERIEQQRVDHMMSKRVRPPWWERALAKLGLRKIDRRPYAESNAARLLVMARRRDRLAREAALYGAPPATADPTSAAGRATYCSRCGLRAPEHHADCRDAPAADDPGLTTVPADPDKYTGGEGPAASPPSGRGNGQRQPRPDCWPIFGVPVFTADDR